MFYNTPRLPRALLHILTVTGRTFVRGPGGQSMPVDEPVKSFWGVVLPLSNLDWKLLPEGSTRMRPSKLKPVRSSETPMMGSNTLLRKSCRTTPSTR